MLTPIAINSGSAPDIDLRVNNPRLRNWYVGEDGVYRTPALASIAALANTKAIHRTTFDNGAYIVVTNDYVYKVFSDGTIAPLQAFISGLAAVRMSENHANQVTIVNGVAALVYDQATGGFTLLGNTEGFDLVNPVDTTCLNTITVILGGTDRKFSVSDPNDAVVYNNNDAVILDASMGDMVAVEEMNNNLYFFGQAAIQRWFPNIERTIYDFPFQLDTSVKWKYGALSTASVQSNVNIIYFLANDFVVRGLSPFAVEPAPTSGPGMGKVIQGYANTQYSQAAFYFYNSQYFYQLTFPDAENSWVLNHHTKVWSESDDMIIGGSTDSAVILSDGVYSLTNTQTFKLCELVTKVQMPPQKMGAWREKVTGVALKLIQGLEQPTEPQFIELLISKDNLTWSNSIKSQIGITGDRQANTTWRMGMTAQQFTFRLRYYGASDITLQSLTADFS